MEGTARRPDEAARRPAGAATYFAPRFARRLRFTLSARFRVA
jgi:hypothetical protein